MDELKFIFASNLIKLRTAAGMTQAELADKISYSDKSISKWERAEAIPDAFVLKKLSEIFNISIDNLLTNEDKWKPTDVLSPYRDRKETLSRLSIVLCIIVSIFTLCLTEFIIVWMVLGKFHWFVLYAAIPISLITVLVLNSLWNKGKYNMYIVMALVFSILLFIFLVTWTYRLWQVVLLIIPAEIIVFLAFQISGGKHLFRKTKKAESEQVTEQKAE